MKRCGQTHGQKPSQKHEQILRGECDYSTIFVIKIDSTEPLQYIKSTATWTHCVESVMGFAAYLETNTSYTDHIPVYNLNFKIETRDQYTYKCSLSWTSLKYMDNTMMESMKWYIENEMTPYIYYKYNTKSQIRVKKMVNNVPTSKQRIPCGIESLLHDNMGSKI